MNTEYDLLRLSEMFAALANPNRLRMLQQLQQKTLNCRSSEDACTFSDHCCNVGELASNLDVSPATVSHHLRELRRAGLVETERQGKFVFCSVNGPALREIGAFLQWEAASASASR